MKTWWKGFAVSVVCAVVFAGVCFSGCGGGGGSSVVNGKLTINNNCSTVTRDYYVNGTLWGTLAPGQSISYEVAPGAYTVKECVTGTSTCITNTDTVSSNVELIYNAC